LSANIGQAEWWPVCVECGFALSGRDLLLCEPVGSVSAPPLEKMYGKRAKFLIVVNVCVMNDTG